MIRLLICAAIFLTFFNQLSAYSEEITAVKLKKGRTFLVKSDLRLSNDVNTGTPVQFDSLSKESIFYPKSPSKVSFKGKVVKTKSPGYAGRSGRIKIALEKITVDNITYPVKALITKKENERVFLNSLGGNSVYLANLGDTISNGTINTIYKDPCTNNICASSTTKPFVYLGAAAIQLADLLVAPIASLFKTGNNLDIPANTYFEIKLDEDLCVISL